MKTRLLILSLFCVVITTTKAQKFYSNTEYNSQYQSGLDTLSGKPIITFDDVLVDTAFLGNTDSLSVNRVVYGIYRGPHAPSVTVKAYYSIVDDTTKVYVDNYLAIPPILIGSVVLDSNKTNKALLQEVSFGDSINPIFKIRNYNDSVVDGYRTFFVGLSFSKPSPKNAWVVTTGSESASIVDYFWEYAEDEPAPYNRAAYKFQNAVATFYLQLYGKQGTTTLPVTFNNFDGIIKDAAALLSWSTTNEFNNKGFEVQRSLDGQNFTTIGFVDGKNSMAQNSYNFTDNKVLSGSNFYRLNQVDKDGRSKLSAAIKLDYSKFAWSVMGNPASSNSWLQLQLDKASNVTVQLVSFNGKVIQNINKGNLNRGTYSLPIGLNNAAPGMYIIKLNVDGQTFTKKIMR